MQIQRRRNIGGTHDDRSCTSGGEYTAQNEHFRLHEVSQGKSALMMFEKHGNLKYKFGNRHFWSEGYYVSTVGLNEETIRKYVREQEKHDQAIDKLSVKEYDDPFTK